MRNLSLQELDAAARLVHGVVPPTPQYRWPLLAERLGHEVWVKHENHTPLGAFKVRGGITYFDELRRNHPEVRGVIVATRGNHGQSIAFAARRNRMNVVIVVPHGNSVEKNASMRALGAELIEHGHDFQAALEHSHALAAERQLHVVPPWHPALVRGVASYGLELFRAAPGLDVVYVPIGLGSGICGMMAARDALGEKAKIVGVVASAAPAVALSFAQKKLIERDCTTRIADGMACRTPDPDALEWMHRGVERIVEVTDDEIEAAMRALFSDTHNVAEGAGAASVAAAMQERDRNQGKRVAVVLTGGNVDRDVFVRVLGAGQSLTAENMLTADSRG